MFVTDSAVSTDRFDPETVKDMLGVQHLRSIAALCNAAEFDASTTHLPISARHVYGDATDQAVLRFSETLGPVDELREKWKKIYELPFNSKNKFMIRTFTAVDPDVVSLALSPDEASRFQREDSYVPFRSMLLRY